MVVDVADKYKNNRQTETEIESDSLEFKNFVQQKISMKKILYVSIFKTSIINSWSSVRVIGCGG